MSSDGFLLVDKAGGWTSHDVVAKVRNLAQIKKVGHAGTLDPMATGLLVLGLGRATRLLRFVQGFPKEYTATAKFGIGTDSLDADGEIAEKAPMGVSADDVRAVLVNFQGRIMQTPPMRSAVKVGGRRLYEIARQGEEVERPAREVQIHELELTGFTPGDYPDVDLRIVCSSGTYVRALADDIARALGGAAHLTSLRRTRNGSHTVDEAVSIDELSEAPELLPSRVMTPAAGLADLGAVEADDELATRISNGAVLARAELAIVGSTGVVDGTGRLIAVYRNDGERLKPEVVLT